MKARYNHTFCLEQEHEDKLEALRKAGCVLSDLIKKTIDRESEKQKKLACLRKELE